ncbi:hypothetical protein A0V43_06455 [Geobacillus sp. JS12]|nr:hypothetical protein A0V43_06455 [Geobacillus sp. JS12]
MRFESEAKGRRVPLSEWLKYMGKTKHLLRKENEDLLRELEEEVERRWTKSFVAVLDPHSEREEGVLFPMMAKYIGRTTGPIAVMEYEHEQAKARLAMFLEKTAQLPENIDKGQALTLAGAVIEAHHILDEHFMKEENVLFPMAERLLSDGEKEELFARMNE